jgi:hypothetical protein
MRLRNVTQGLLRVLFKSVSVVSDGVSYRPLAGPALLTSTLGLDYAECSRLVRSCVTLSNA